MIFIGMNNVKSRKSVRRRNTKHGLLYAHSNISAWTNSNATFLIIISSNQRPVLIDPSKYQQSILGIVVLAVDVL